MSEIGGTTTQSGILYQNSIAALYLGRLIDPRSRVASERVVEVRVEAPEHVDDIVIRCADGSRIFIQAKESVTINSAPWNKIWTDFEQQISSAHTIGQVDQLILIVGNFTHDIGVLREACVRAKGKVNDTEWWNSLSENHRAIVSKLYLVLSNRSRAGVFDVLQRVQLYVWPFYDIEQIYILNWMPPANKQPVTVFQAIRDKIGGYARVRAIFRSSELIQRIFDENEIIITDVLQWGGDVYREAVRRMFGRISVPGTTLSGPIEKLFMWINLEEQSHQNQRRDFEEEDLRWRDSKNINTVDIRNFPRGKIRRAVINAGAGFGKSTLLSALAVRLCKDSTVFPVMVPLDDLVSKKISALDYLKRVVNIEFCVSIDWERLCESGRVTILFDGLDELGISDRAWALRTISLFGSRFPDVPFLLAVRDSTALATPLGIPVLCIQRLDIDQIENFATNYLIAGSNVEPQRLKHYAEHHPELAHLLRIPLFLALVLATLGPDDDLPSSRTELLEQYLRVLFEPREHKSWAMDYETLSDLREIAEQLAFLGLEAGSIGLSELEAKRYLKKILPQSQGEIYLECLIRFGIMRRTGIRLHFSYPIIQEYLAGRWLLRNAPDEIEKRFQFVVQRPWAQAVQFALEQHLDAARIIRSALREADDAYCTILRLVARCVVNGANVDSDLHNEIGSRLADAWKSDSYAVSLSITYLLCDGFINPLPESALAQLIDGRMLDEAAGAILVAMGNHDITRRVLAAYLNRPLINYYLHGWQQAVDAIAMDALVMYLARARSAKTTEDEIAALASLIQNLPVNAISPQKWLEISIDENLSPLIRLTGHAFGPHAVSSDTWLLMDKVLFPWFQGDEYSSVGYFALKMLSNHEEINAYLHSLVRNSSVPLRSVREIAVDLVQNDIASDESTEAAFMKIAMDDTISADRKFIFLVLAGVLKNKSAAISAAKMLHQQPFENVDLWCNFAHYYPKEASLLGADALRQKELSDDEFVELLPILSAVITSAFSSASSSSYNQVPEVTQGSFLSWIKERVELIKGDPFKKLLAFAGACQSGCDDLREALYVQLEDVMKISPESLSEKSINLADHAIAIALSALNDGNIIKEETLWKLFGKWNFETDQEILYQIDLRANDISMLRLIDIYAHDNREFIRSKIFANLEKLASRYGKRVVRQENHLELTEW